VRGIVKEVEVESIIRVAIEIAIGLCAMDLSLCLSNRKNITARSLSLICLSFNSILTFLGTISILPLLGLGPWWLAQACREAFG